MMKKMMVSFIGLMMCVLSVQAATPEGWKQAKWIGFGGKDQRDEHYSIRKFTYHNGASNTKKSYPAPLLRTTFDLPAHKVKRATLYVSGLGYYYAFLNGKRLAPDNILQPAPTTHEKRSFYNVLDATECIKKGKNALGIGLGSGFFGQNCAFGGGLVYGAPLAKAALVIDHHNGSSMTVITDGKWVGSTGAVLFDNVYAGETYDARKEIKGWSLPEFNASQWSPVRTRNAPSPAIVEQHLPSMRKMKKISPVRIISSEEGGYIIDLGINMTGWLEIALQEESGCEVKMRFAEVLKPSGKAIDTATTGGHATGCEQVDIYICKGGEKKRWEPSFTYHGFRYVHITGLSKKPEPTDFTAWFIHTDLEKIGTFQCSDPLINRFYEVSMRTIEGNMQGLLSDCPHRERCAWLGDMHAVGEAVSMNYAAKPFWQKTINDFKTVLGLSAPVPFHYPKGNIPPRDPRAPANIACGKRLCGQARPDWGLAVILVPWYNWLYFGDQKTTEDAWGMMTGYLAYLEEYETENHLIKEGYAYGDWCPPGSNAAMDTPPDLSASALYYQALCAMKHMAQSLNKDPEPFASKAHAVKQAFNKKYYDSFQKSYGSQTASAMAIFLGLVPSEDEPLAVAALNELIKRKNGYSTGILGHRHLYSKLNEYGFDSTTAMLWSKTEFPSLGYMTEEHGLTTWPEVPVHWPKGKPYRGNSFNHPMQSGFAVALHESIAGIRPDPRAPGFKRITLQPCFLKGLDWVKCSYESVQGKIVSNWRREGDQIVWEVTVPQGAVADLLVRGVLKDQKLTGRKNDFNTYQTKAGTYRFVLHPAVPVLPKPVRYKVKTPEESKVKSFVDSPQHVSQTPKLASKDSYSWVLKVKPLSANGEHAILMGNRGNPGNNNFLKITETSAQLFIGNRKVFVLRGLLQKNEWNEVVLSKDGPHFSYYINCSKKGEVEIKETIPAMPCFLGGDMQTGMEKAHCQIAVGKTLKRAVTREEIGRLFE